MAMSFVVHIYSYQMHAGFTIITYLQLPIQRVFLHRRQKCCAGRRDTSPSIVVTATCREKYRLRGRTHFRLLDGEEPDVCGLREIKMAALDTDVDVW